ncbi:MAG: methylmalonyl-CoA epimerase [Chloroflexi bacterium]|nr:methylmalonyl-CoA epimerase [Chloroflexota bacterium]
MAPPGDIAESVLPPEQRRPVPDALVRPSADQPSGTVPDATPREPLAVHHVGVAVHDIDEAMHFYQGVMGMGIVDRRVLPDRLIEVAFVQTGNTLIELLQPTDPASNVAKFLDRRGPGLHHLCFGTVNIDEHLRELKEQGVALIDETARPGAHGDVAFLQPASTFGVLVELIQPAPAARDDGAASAPVAEEEAGELIAAGQPESTDGGSSA